MINKNQPRVQHKDTFEQQCGPAPRVILPTTTQERNQKRMKRCDEGRTLSWLNRLLASFLVVALCSLFSTPRGSVRPAREGPINGSMDRLIDSKPERAFIDHWLTHINARFTPKSVQCPLRIPLNAQLTNVEPRLFMCTKASPKRGRPNQSLRPCDRPLSRLVQRATITKDLNTCFNRSVGTAAARGSWPRRQADGVAGSPCGWARNGPEFSDARRHVF